MVSAYVLNSTILCTPDDFEYIKTTKIIIFIKTPPIPFGNPLVQVRVLSRVNSYCLLR